MLPQAERGMSPEDYTSAVCVLLIAAFVAFSDCTTAGDSKEETLGSNDNNVKGIHQKFSSFCYLPPFEFQTRR